MEHLTQSPIMLVYLDLSSWKSIMVLCVLGVIIARRKGRALLEGMKTGLITFMTAIRKVCQDIERNPENGGRSLGGIYGKKAAEAITPDNHVAELYNPEALTSAKPRSNKGNGRFRRIFDAVVRLFRNLMTSMTY